MKRALVYTAALLACTSLVFAADPFIGSWNANMEKSQTDPNHRAKQAGMRFEEASEGYRLTVSGINGKGETVSNTIVLYLDGKEHPAPGEENAMMSASKPDPLTLELVGKKDGHETGRTLFVVSQDGTVLTTTASGKDGKDRPFKSVMVLEKAQ